MKIDIKNPPDAAELLQIILDLQNSLQQKETELENSKVELIGYKEKYARLIEEMRLAKQQRFSPSSEKNIFQADLFDEAGIVLPDEIEEEPEGEAQDSIKRHKKHPVRRALPLDLPREVVLHDLLDTDKICKCGHSLKRIGEEITEQLKYIPAKLSVIQHVRPKYACKPCQENVKIAPMPSLLLPKSRATPELIAHTIIAKYCDHLPLYRQAAIWQRLDIDLPRSSLCSWILKIAGLCEPLIREMRGNIIAGDYVQADETTVQVLDEVGRDNTSKSYMWVYRGGTSLSTNIVYEYQETRGGYHAQSFLNGFAGYLQTDAYSGYQWALKEEEIITVGCMAHARRPFAELAKLSKKVSLATEAVMFFKKLYAIEKEARYKNLSSDARHQFRHEKAPPILEGFKKWLDTSLTKTPQQSKIGQAIQYAIRHWEVLTNYLKDGRIEIDNNAVENVIRPFALGRKNWLFAGSPKGASAGATLFSLIETCKANGVEPYQYFCTMLTQIRLCKSSDDYQKLLPQFINL